MAVTPDPFVVLAVVGLSAPSFGLDHSTWWSMTIHPACDMDA